MTIVEKGRAGQGLEIHTFQTDDQMASSLAAQEAGDSCLVVIQNPSCQMAASSTSDASSERIYFWKRSQLPQDRQDWWYDLSKLFHPNPLPWEIVVPLTMTMQLV